jgi:hypothetical protein
MALRLDARIPLVCGQASDALPADALLLEGEGDASPMRDWFLAGGETGHPAKCACCVPRNAAGQALSRLLLARARTHGPRFGRVIAVVRTPAGHDAVLAALQSDPLASSCFALYPGGPAP